MTVLAAVFALATAALGLMLAVKCREVDRLGDELARFQQQLYRWMRDEERLVTAVWSHAEFETARVAGARPSS